MCCKNDIPLDKRSVVPYNPYLSKKYNAHINVEICSSIRSCKYLYKYVYKGPDMASVAIEVQSSESDQEKRKDVDEINKYVNSRFMTLWRDIGEFWVLMCMDEIQVFNILLCMKKIYKW